MFGNNRTGALGLAGHANEGPPIVASAPQVSVVPVTHVWGSVWRCFGAVCSIHNTPKLVTAVELSNSLTLVVAAVLYRGWRPVPAVALQRPP